MAHDIWEARRHWYLRLMPWHKPKLEESLQEGTRTYRWAKADRKYEAGELVSHDE